MPKLVEKIRAQWFFLIASAAVFIAYALIFEPYFPNAQGGLGHDYEQQLPNLLAGYFWFQNNGFFSIPWFNPAQCGGVPFYADPGHGFYSLPQFLVLFFNPLLAIKITFFAFALAGYFGFYFLLRRKFQIDTAFSVLGATLFLFNGFYASRMIIGHPFHAFMLLPYLVILLLPPSSPPQKPQNFFSLRNILAAALAGAVMAYMFHSAMIHLIPPVMLAVIVILLIHAWLYPVRSKPPEATSVPPEAERTSNGVYGMQKGAWLRFGISGIIALGLSASKLIASFSFLAYFQRDYYSLPGFPKLADEFSVILRSIFFRPPTESIMKLIANSQWAIEQHELELGITPLPLVVIAAAALYGAFLFIIRRGGMSPSKRGLGYAAAIALLLLIPAVFNFYSPEWNKILKNLPLIKNSVLLLRWFAAYIPVSILAAALILNFYPRIKKFGLWISAASVIFVIAYQASANRDYYKAQTYDGSVIVAAYQRSKSSGRVAPITGIAVYDPEEAPDPSRGQNDLMVAGFSQLACYNAIFGYRLEKFPIGDLHPGPALEITEGHFNIKNPACYVFPQENNCRPGDQFLASRRQDAEKFLQYKPYSFRKSPLQKSADAINLGFLSILGLSLIYSLTASVLTKKARRI